MLKIYKSEDGVLVEAQDIEPNTWIDASNPTPEELHHLAKYFKLPVETITDPLDVDERARCETDEDYNMIIYRIPTYEENEAKGYRQYFTVPLGIILVQGCMITICRRDTNVIHNLFKQKNKHLYVKHFPYLILQIFWQTSLTYLSDLKDINTNTSIVQKKLESSMSNKHLFGMMAQEKTLVYFTTSLRSNDFMLDRLKRMAFFRKGLTEEEEDLLDDVIVENRQALETAKIYNDILTGMIKNPPAMQEMLREAGSLSGSGRSPGGGHVNPLQYSCLENPMNRGAWQATVHGVAKELDRVMVAS